MNLPKNVEMSSKASRGMRCFVAGAGGEGLGDGIGGGGDLETGSALVSGNSGNVAGGAFEGGVS